MSETTLTEAERELLSGLCDGDAWKGAGEDGYCYAHHAPVKWAGHANASDVCCLDVEDYVEQVLALRANPPAQTDHRPNGCCDYHRHIADGCCHCERDITPDEPAREPESDGREGGAA